MRVTARIVIDLVFSNYWHKHISLKLSIIDSDGGLDLFGIITYTADSNKPTKYWSN